MAVVLQEKYFLQRLIQNAWRSFRFLPEESEELAVLPLDLKSPGVLAVDKVVREHGSMDALLEESHVMSGVIPPTPLILDREVVVTDDTRFLEDLYIDMMSHT
jgi:hypothetical protein